MPPITPEQLAEASTRLDKLTQKLEKTILDDICRRIARAGTITDTAEWQMMRLKEMGYANEVIEKAIADYTKMSEAEIRQLFFEAGQVSDDFYEEVYSKAGMPFVPLEDNPYMQQFLSAGIEQTNNELVNFTKSMGFAVRQPDGSLAFQGVAKTYQSALDLAQMQVATGVFDYTTAIRNATKSLTDSGLQFVDYASGHRNRADVAARRAVLTGISQMTGKVSEQNMQELDTDIVETSAHAGARPDHAVWQGKWFSFSGKSTTYPSLVAETGYGTGAGLKGWNCRHDFYPVIPGISEPSYTDEELANIDPPPVEYSGKTLTYYECTQKQRAMETAMRKTKREIIAAEASGDEDMLTAKSILLRRQREEYAKFSKEAGLLTQNERTQVYGFGKSVAQKARWKASLQLAHQENYTISQKSVQNSFTVNRKLVNSKAYHDKFENISEHRPTNESVCQQAKRLLEHRDGTDFESMIVLDSRTGIVVTDNISIGSNEPLKTGLSEEQYQKVIEHTGNVIIMHNHPGSYRPSGTDILTLWKEEKADISVIVGHDGSVFSISKINRKISLDKIYEKAYNDAKELGYSDAFARIKATDALYKSGAFEYMEV